MKIAGFETKVVRPVYDDYAIAGYQLLLRVQTDDGMEGIAYASRVGPGAMGFVQNTVGLYMEELKGLDPLRPEAIRARLFRPTGALPGFLERAYSLIDTALWDIAGKATGQPVFKLMGGHRDRVPCYASWHIEHQGPEELVESARHLVDQGFRAMKFHTRQMDNSGVVNHLRLLRETVGPSVDIMIDVKESWDVKETIAMAKALAPYNPYWIEDPLPRDDYEGLRAVKDAVEVRICAGEAYRSLPQFRHLISKGSVDIAMVDLDVGMTGFLKVAHLAEAFGLPVVNHLETEVMAHGIAAVPNGLTVEYYPWALPLWKEPPQLDAEGRLVLTDRPGFGLEFDEKAVAKFAVN